MVFSKRELDVIRLITFEYTTQEIANTLYVSFDTVKTHRSNIIKKFQVRNTAGIVRKALQTGLIPLEAAS